MLVDLVLDTQKRRSSPTSTDPPGFNSPQPFHFGQLTNFRHVIPQQYCKSTGEFFSNSISICNKVARRSYGKIQLSFGFFYLTVDFHSFFFEKLSSALYFFGFFYQNHFLCFLSNYRSSLVCSFKIRTCKIFVDADTQR